MKSKDFEKDHKWTFDKRRRKLDRCEGACLELISALRVEREWGSEGRLPDEVVELARRMLRYIHDGYDDVDMREQQHRIYVAAHQTEEDDA